MSIPAVVGVDPVEQALAYIRTTFIPTKAATWTAGHDIPANPSKFIRVEWVGGDTVQTIAGRERLRVQVFGESDNPDDYARMAVARSLVAYLRRDFYNARRTAGPIDLPDPADPERQISQFTIEALLPGVQE